MNPRRRAQTVRGVLYAALLALVAAVVVLADWGQLQDAFGNLGVAAAMFPEVIVIAAKNTIIYTAAAFVFGLIAGLLLALMKLSSIGPYRWIATGWIELFRGLPALITLLLIGFGLPIALGFNVPGGVLGDAAVGLGIVMSAYMAETIRAGIQAVPKGQMEAARSLGMSRPWAMTSIIIPQGFRIIVPPLTNELVLLIKDSSLLFVLGTTPLTLELTKFARDAMQRNFNATPLVVVALTYLAITLPLTQLVAVMERRQARAR